MKAFIMAAGYGTRLEPLTLAVPKPLVPIANLPVMQRNIELLVKYGLTEVYANLHYFPEQIQNYFGHGSSYGVDLQYSLEKELLGTAGGVKLMAKNMAKIKETFVVLSSDALTDIDLDKMIKYHKDKKALATIALSRVDDISQFGVALHDEENRITGFQEKPKLEEALSSVANTGIYIFEPEILELIPEGFYDFGSDLFPRLVKEKAALFGYLMSEYWSDVGSLDKYIEANFDVLKGNLVALVPGEKKSPESWVGEQEIISGQARLEGYTVIGDHCFIGKDVLVRDSIIGSRCHIADGATISDSIIWPDAYIGKEVQVNKAIIGAHCRLTDGARVFDGAVLANRVKVSKDMIVSPGARVIPNTAL